MRTLNYKTALQVASLFLPEIPRVMHAQLNGIYHHNGHIVASDATALIRLSANYEPQREGKILDIDGNPVQTDGEHYPKYEQIIRAAIEDNHTELWPDWNVLARLCWFYTGLNPENADKACTINDHVFAVRNVYRVAMTALYLGLRSMFVPKNPADAHPSFITDADTDAFILIANGRSDNPVFKYDAGLAEPNF